jgi:23S rRNA pseudouridine2605 synthase
MPQEGGQRLQKALARVGLGSRREIEAWIRAGRLTVNGRTAELGTRVHESDRIRLDGRLVRQRPAAAGQVFLCHRSPGEPLDAAVLIRSAAAWPARAPAADRAAAHGAEHGSQREAARDASARPGLLERLPRSSGRRFIAVSPMPRNDGGLELVTSDGEIAERLQRAVRRLTGEFSVRLHGALEEAQLGSVRAGVLDSGARLEVLECEPRGGEGANQWYALTARGASGKEVRQLFERSGGTVSRVLRTRLGSVALDRSLSRGRFRRLQPAELDALLGAGEESRRERQRRARSTARRSSPR